VTNTRAKRRDSTLFHRGFNWRRKAAALVRPFALHANNFDVSNRSPFVRKIEESFVFDDGARLYGETLRDRGESDNLQPDENGHSYGRAEIASRVLNAKRWGF